MRKLDRKRPINKEYLNELLNSCITLNEKETQIVEEHLLSQCKQVSRRYLLNAMALSAIRTGKETKTLGSNPV
jgi:hypothetical protein